MLAKTIQETGQRLGHFRGQPLCLFVLAIVVPYACELRSVVAQSTHSSGQAAKTAETYYVAEQSAIVMSGPGNEYYACARIKSGTAVHAYHETQNGWLAIRPPNGSYSWIQARDATLLPGGTVIEITNDRAVSWIGSQLGSARQYRWQVQLSQGEQLAVLGEKNVATPKGNQLWYQVAPPNGEYRWISKHAVTKKLPIKSQGESSQSLPTPSHQKNDNRVGVSVISASAQDEVFGDTEELPPPTRTSPPAAPSLSQMGESILAEEPPLLVPSTTILEAPAPTVSEHVSESSPNVSMTQQENHFAGWHAFDFSHLRFPLLERIFRHRPTPVMTDPLAHDPYDLSIARPIPQAAPANIVTGRNAIHHQAPELLPESLPIKSGRWRSPAELRKQRQLGRPGLDVRSDTPRTLADKISNRISTLRGERGDQPRHFSGSNDPVGRQNTQWQSRTSPSSETRNASKLTDEQMADEVARIRQRWLGQTEFASNSMGPRGIPATLASSTTSIDQSPMPRPTPSANLPSLNGLQLELSEMVTQPMHLWNFASLRAQARELIKYGQSPLERGQARLLLERIEEFQALANRSGLRGTTTSQTSSAVTPAAPPISLAGYTSPHNSTSEGVSGINSLSRSSNANAAYQSKPVFDATGWLVPVHNSTRPKSGRPQPGEPSYALTDATGSTVAYITTNGTLNLDRFLNQRVGIQGLRGYLPNLRAAHIQASRIVRLQ